MDKIELSVFFCDDVRDEVGNKQSYMGLLSDRMLLPAGTKRLKGIVAVGLVRIKGHRQLPAEMVVEVPGRDEPLEMGSQMITAPDNDYAWTVHLHAGLNNLQVIDGFVLKAKLTVGDVMVEDSLVMNVLPEEEPELSLEHR